MSKRCGQPLEAHEKGRKWILSQSLWNRAHSLSNTLILAQWDPFYASGLITLWDNMYHFSTYICSIDHKKQRKTIKALRVRVSFVCNSKLSEEDLNTWIHIYLKVYFILTTLDLFRIFSVCSFIQFHPANHCVSVWHLPYTSVVADLMIGLSVFLPPLTSTFPVVSYCRECTSSLFWLWFSYMTPWPNIWKKWVLSQGLRVTHVNSLAFCIAVLPLP